LARAGVAELVDALDLGSSDESCGGSSPSARTIMMENLPRHWFPDGLKALQPESCEFRIADILYFLAIY
jgi:hypothetical protein